MNNYILLEKSDFSRKLQGYTMMFNYRMTNMCVKAEPTAMLPVTIYMAGSGFNFEDVAVATMPDDYTFDVIPKNQNNLQNIIEGVFDMHPEFKMELKTETDADDNVINHIIYTMPPVDKDRRKLMIDAVKLFHKECKISIDAAYVELQARLVEPYLEMKPEEVDEARTMFKEILDSNIKNAEKLLNIKLMEIEEGYQRYLENKTDVVEDKKEPLYTKGFRMGDE